MFRRLRELERTAGASRSGPESCIFSCALAAAGSITAMYLMEEPWSYAKASELDWEAIGFPTSTVSIPPGRAYGPAENVPAMSGAAGLSVVSVCTRPQSHVFVSVPYALCSVATALASASITCRSQVFEAVTLKLVLTSSQNACVFAVDSMLNNARISPPGSPVVDRPVVAETTAKSSSKTLCSSLTKKVWNRRHPADWLSTVASVTAALFGSVPLSPVGQSYPADAQAVSTARPVA